MSYEQMMEAYTILAKHETADDIAGFMRAHGIQAAPRHPRECAISQYMKQNGAAYVHTNVSSTSFAESDDVYDAEYLVKAHTAPMVEFVRNFDSLFYPDLVVDA